MEEEVGRTSPRGQSRTAGVQDTVQFPHSEEEYPSTVGGELLLLVNSISGNDLVTRDAE